MLTLSLYVDSDRTAIVPQDIKADFKKKKKKKKHDPVGSLCITILLRMISSCMESENARVVTECVELGGHVLATLVVMQSLDLSTQLHLSKSLEQLEGSERVTLPLEHDRDSIARMVVNEDTPVTKAFWG